MVTLPKMRKLDPFIQRETTVYHKNLKIQVKLIKEIAIMVDLERVIVFQDCSSKFNLYSAKNKLTAGRTPKQRSKQPLT